MELCVTKRFNVAVKTRTDKYVTRSCRNLALQRFLDEYTVLYSAHLEYDTIPTWLLLDQSFFLCYELESKSLL